jgi:hypothetical protein
MVVSSDSPEEWNRQDAKIAEREEERRIEVRLPDFLTPPPLWLLFVNLASWRFNSPCLAFKASTTLKSIMSVWLCSVAVRLAGPIWVRSVRTELSTTQHLGACLAILEFLTAWIKGLVPSVHPVVPSSLASRIVQEIIADFAFG